ncbi:hypothetical protein DFH27DRAFT_611227 [Peziza echinospora]|nr:hypothetical protein DFH27DRAFT_611227 [Peziza echinospora]
MPKVVWSADNDRKLLIRLIDRSAKSYDSASLALLFPGATPKAIEERIAKLKREAKALDGPGKSMRSHSAGASPKGKGRRGKVYGGNEGTQYDDDDDDDEGEEEERSNKRVKKELGGDEVDDLR